MRKVGYERVDKTLLYSTETAGAKGMVRLFDGYMKPRERIGFVESVRSIAVCRK